LLEIQIPKLSDYLKINQLSTIPYGAGGIYFIYDKSKTLVYLGKAKDLNSRLSAHFQGKTHTKEFHHKFNTFKYFINSSALEREIYETYLINRLNPLNNTSKVYDDDRENFENQNKDNFIGFIIKLMKINRNSPIGIHTVKQICENNNIQVFSFYDEYINQKLIKNKIIINPRELHYAG
jgi:hypothetical protein